MSALPFSIVCAMHGLPTPVAEYRFAPPRRWRWDHAWPPQMLALEVNGGIWTQAAEGAAQWDMKQ